VTGWQATDEPDAIKEVLLDVAKVMAIQRKEQRQAQKDEALQQVIGTVGCGMAPICAAPVFSPARLDLSRH
jgi:hypothetical protein